MLDQATPKVSHIAVIYRLAPDNTLDWLDDPILAQDEATLERWENHLDWLEPETRPLPHPVEDASEPERDR